MLYANNDFVEARHPESTATTHIELTFWKDDDAVHGVLMFFRVTDDGQTYCRDVRGFDGRFDRSWP